MKRPNTGSKGKTWEVIHRQVPIETQLAVVLSIIEGATIPAMAKALKLSEYAITNIIYRYTTGIRRIKYDFARGVSAVEILEQARRIKGKVAA